MRQFPDQSRKSRVESHTAENIRLPDKTQHIQSETIVDALKKTLGTFEKNVKIKGICANCQRKGLDFDMRKNVNEEISKAAEDKSYAIKMVEKFHEKNIKNRNFTYLVIGDENKVDMDFLKKLGEFKKFTIDEICGDEKVKRP